MQLRKDIPSYVSFDGEKLPVNYLGQPPTCAHCSSLDHLASACPSQIAHLVPIQAQGCPNGTLGPGRPKYV
jgi:hypothetical protein